MNELDLLFSYRTLIVSIPAVVNRPTFTSQTALEDKYILDIKDVTPATGTQYNQSPYVANFLDKKSLIVYQAQKQSLLVTAFHKELITIDNLSLDSSFLEIDTPAPDTIILFQVKYISKILFEKVR